MSWRPPRARRRRRLRWPRSASRSAPRNCSRALSDAWVEFRGIWDNGRGFAEIRKLWLERAVGLGERVAIQSGNATVEGTFDTIDETGCLIIRTADGKRVPIAAGEVYFGAAASVGAA